jgi:dipeptidyl aminopeptidase/acylaminoacyl peptidase
MHFSHTVGGVSLGAAQSHSPPYIYTIRSNLVSADIRRARGYNPFRKQVMPAPSWTKGDPAMAPFLALLAFLQAAGVNVERVTVPGPNGVGLDAALVLPEGTAKAPPVVALHGCGGPFPSRDGQWAVLLAKAGHVVLLPDSFGSRGLGSQCGTPRNAR